MTTFFQPIFIGKEQLSEELQMMSESGFNYEGFMTWATRKLKGYSVAEIDHMAKRITTISTHEEKTDCIERVQDATTAAKKEMDAFQAKMDRKKPDDVNKLAYLKEHLSILQRLLERAKTFDIIEHLDKESGKDKPVEPPKPGESKGYVIKDST